MRFRMSRWSAKEKPTSDMTMIGATMISATDRWSRAIWLMILTAIARVRSMLTMARPV